MNGADASAWYHIDYDDGTVFELDTWERENLLQRLRNAAETTDKEVAIRVTKGQQQLVSSTLWSRSLARLILILIAAFGRDWRKHNLGQRFEGGDYFVLLFNYDEVEFSEQDYPNEV